MEAKFYKKLSNNQIQCRLCAHFCLIGENQTGICRARENKNGGLYSLVYGYPAALNIDPIEKKSLFHFLPGSLAYSLGTFGCNFACSNCQNWDLSQEENIRKKNQELNFSAPEKIVSEALASGCRSIACTYNEPTIWAEYALDIMKLARLSGLKNVWVTNGFMSEECLEAIIPFLDAANIDLKSFNEDFYRANCGARLSPVLNNLKKIKQAGVHLEITTLIIPTLSDEELMLKKMAHFIAEELDPETPWHLSKFSPEISWKLEHLSSTDKEKLFRAREIGQEAGLKYVYIGNIPGLEAENTYCPACGDLAVRRFGYKTERLDHTGSCAACGQDLNLIL